MARNLLFLLLSLLPFLSEAAEQPGTTCPNSVERHANIQLQMLFSPTDRVCFLTITRKKASTLLYRDYLLSNDGVLMVFNSFGDGDEASSTGAREFYFYPHILSNPSYVWNDQDRRLEVMHTNGDVLYFDYDTAEITASKKGQFTVNPDIKAENRGGVEISNYQGFILDAGFALGKSPASVSSASALLTDRLGKVCQVKNNKVFKTIGSQDIRLRYDDLNLGNFLKNSCPQLVFP